MKIKKAVIPAAGLGTRMLPIARAVPKEMLPVVDRPALSYLVEEAAAAGAEDVLIITNRGKGAIEDYFDYSPEYEEKFVKKGKPEEIERLRAICKKANVYFLRQHEAKGLGAAVLCARAFTGDEPFFVLYGDDVVFGRPACEELAEAYEKYGLSVAGVKPVDMSQIYKYSSLDARPIEGDDKVCRVFDMIEKPAPGQEFSNLSILGRVLLTPEIYPILEATPPAAGGGLQLTDAMKTLARTTGMTAVAYSGTRYDLGSKLGFLMANVEQALVHPEVGEAFRAYLKGLKID